jgi:selenide, water dikinase
MRRDARQAPVVKDLVLVGGGHSHVGVLRRFGMRPLAGARLTLISRESHAPYSGMLPGLIAGHYDFDDAHIDLGPLCRFAGAGFVHAEVTGLDLRARRVVCRDRPPVAYDVLSIDVGAAPATADVPGAAGAVVPVKPIDGFVAHWERLRARCLAAADALAIGAVGGGAGGVELLLAVQHRLRSLLAPAGRSAEHLTFHLVTDGPEILPSHNARVRAAFRRVLAARGVHVLTDHRVVRVADGRLHFAHGGELALDEILWVTTAGAPPWPRDAGLAVDARGFIEVNEGLQSVSHPDVFAAGDVAALVRHPRPKSGVFAVRAARPLAANLGRRLRGRPLRPFTPQRRFLSLISTGDRYAVASRGNWAAEGRWVWRWKDRIDRRFVRRYNRLPAPRARARPPVARGLVDQAAIAELSAVAMRCGGCGAKVGSDVLGRVLTRLAPPARADVLVGLDGPDDAAVLSVPPDKVLVQTVDFFRAFIDDPFVFGQVAANHALGDVFAMGAAPAAALAVVTVPYAPEEKVEELLVQVLSGALVVLGREQTVLVGGHTSEGAELALGFAVSGFAARAALLSKRGMRPGDALVLTKALGTGALFAADMRLRAKSRWITAALAAMTQSSRAAADCLAAHGATAMTDVTGFGLLGHLMEMVGPSSVDVELDLAALPALDGALEVIGRGIFSSLQPQNLRLRRAVRDAARFAGDPRFALLFDPQTAGGLLASVPAARAAACVDELRRLGYGASAVVGTVRAPHDAATPVTLRA